MKTFVLSTILLLPAAAGAFVADPATRIAAAEASAPHARSDNRFSGMILRLTPGTDIAALEEHGIVIWNSRNDMVLACVPQSLMAELDKVPGIERASVARCASPEMDIARSVTHAEAVATAAQLPQAYTGSGVTVGFSDSGFDPGHIAFAGRVTGARHYCDSLATITEFVAGSTDNADMTHATHVANIMAGADMASPYHGIATGANIVATTSGLYDVEILAGVEYVINSAKAAGQPAVVNLSLGSSTGPHDGTDAFCRYLDLCAADAAIVMSAGNYGTGPICATHTFSDEAPSLALMYDPIDWSRPDHLICYTDIWSDSSSPIDIRFHVWNILDMAVEYTTDWAEIDTRPDKMYELSGDTDATFGKYFAGRTIAAAEVNPDNGRYNIAVSHQLANTTRYPDKTFGLRLMIIEIRSQAGNTVDAFIGGTGQWKNSGLPSWISKGDSHISISSMACGRNTICVGSATSRASAPLVAGGESSWYEPSAVGGTSSFSSWGNTHDGRALPHFCAPGAMVVSAMSKPYLTAHPGKAASVSAYSPTDRSCAYFADSGTSMASPHAAGIMALWLEAEPTLSPAELRDIAIATARPDGVDMYDPRTGAGMIDALAGLRMILGMDGMQAPSVSLVKVWRNGNSLQTEGFDPATMSMQIYDLAGRQLSPGRLPSEPIIVKIVSTHDITVKRL